MELLEVVEDVADVLERVRPVDVAGELDHVPGGRCSSRSGSVTGPCLSELGSRALALPEASRHSAASAWSWSSFRSVGRRFSRGSTRSSIPCSIRNSAVWKPSGSVWRIVCSITFGPAKPT